MSIDTGLRKQELENLTWDDVDAQIVHHSVIPVFLDDGHILLRISYRSAAGELENIPYGLAVSFEVAVDAGIQGYDQIRARLAARVRAVVSGD